MTDNVIVLTILGRRAVFPSLSFVQPADYHVYASEQPSQYGVRCWHAAATAVATTHHSLDK